MRESTIITIKDGFRYDPQLMKHFVQDAYSEHFYCHNPTDPDYTGNITKEDANRICRQLQEMLYFINPNPSEPELTYLVYEIKNTSYYCIYENTVEVLRKQLQEQYKLIWEGFRAYYPFKRFISGLEHYYQKKITSNSVLFKDGIVFDFNEERFIDESYELPAFVTRYESKEMNTKEIDLNKPLTINKKDKEVLTKCFREMYPQENQYKQFLYYILCNINKNFCRQTIFLIIDASGVGKTSRVLFNVLLGYNKILDSRLLQKSELYNITSSNSVIYNETQTENLDGSTLSNLADAAPITVTRKGQSSLTIEADEKPLIQIMGESLPLFKSLNNGTNRRFVLVPNTDPQYKKFIENTHNAEIVNRFFEILNNKPVTMLKFYLSEIKKFNIDKIHDSIRKSMFVTLKDLEALIENKEAIFEKYFNLNPTGKDDYVEEKRYILSVESLELILDYINNYIITVSHFNTVKLAKSYLRKLIKENGHNAVNSLGKCTSAKVNYFFYYSLTPAGVKLVEEINDKGLYDEKIDYLVYSD